MPHRAVFLDRDGTIIEDPGYVDRPEKVCLLPGAAEAIRRLRDAGFRVVVASNQSGVARGYFDEAALAAVHDRLETLLRQGGTAIDGAYYCPFLDGPDATVEAYRRASDLRKPSPGMLLRAADDLELDLTRSWMIGDSPCDVEAGRRAGCRAVLIRKHGGSVARTANDASYEVDSLLEAVELVLSRSSDVSEPMTRTPNDGPPKQDDVAGALERIHDQLERANRQGRQADFSLLRLFAALLQMFALVCALWGLFPLLNDQAGVATARLLLACFFQLASITAFAIDRFR
jgi:D-glycero-D-manno-heptose 1,7-bisphosphate phosphatase